MKDWMKWLNPLYWLETVWTFFASVIGSILQFFGFDQQPPLQHDDIQPDDVDRAYDEATAAEAIEDFSPEMDRRTQGFLSYIKASPEERATFDLSVFEQDMQDFVLGLTEDDVQELRSRGTVGQLQAALIGRIPPGAEIHATQEVYLEPSNAAPVGSRFLTAVRGRLEYDADTYGINFASGR